MEIKSKECIIKFEDKDDHLEVEVRINKKTAETMTKSFWKEYSKSIKVNGFRTGKVPLSMAKKVKVPIDQMMCTAYSQYANIKFTESAPRKVILTADHKTEGATTTFNAWLEPEVTLAKEELDKVLDNTFKIPQFNNDRYIDDRLYAFQKLHPDLRNKESSMGGVLPSSDGDMVEIKVDCVVDGQPYKEGCEEATRVRLLKDTIRPPSLYDRLLGVVPGHEFMLETNDIPRAWGDKLHGKMMKLFVKILRVYLCEESKVDDDLAITAGFKSLEEWKRSLNDSADRMAAGQYEMHKKQLVIAAILGIAKVGDFPAKWLDEKIKELEHLKEPDLRNKVHEVAKHTTILKKVGELLGVEWDDAEKVNVMREEDKYAQKVLSELVSRMKCENVNPVLQATPEGNREVATQTTTP